MFLAHSSNYILHITSYTWLFCVCSVQCLFLSQTFMVQQAVIRANCQSNGKSWILTLLQHLTPTLWLFAYCAQKYSWWPLKWLNQFQQNLTFKTIFQSSAQKIWFQLTTWVDFGLCNPKLTTMRSVSLFFLFHFRTWPSWEDGSSTVNAYIN